MRIAFILSIFLSSFGSSALAENNPCLPPPEGGLDKSFPCYYHSPIPEADYKVFFESGSYNLTNTAKAILDRQAKVLKPFPDLEIRIEGFADTREAPEPSQMKALGQKRASAVGEYLIGKGINPESILMAGSEHPPLIPKREDEQGLSAMRFVMTDASGNLTEK